MIDVTLGMNHQPMPDASPLLFETMVFGEKFDEDQHRYSTWDEAVSGHKKITNKIKAIIDRQLI